jgi:putative transposase
MLKEYKGKKVITETSKLDIRVPRDREGTFDCPLSTAFPWFRRQDRVDVCARRADAVLETVGERQNRPLEESYPLVLFDALRVKIREEGLVRNKAVYIALGVQADGTKDILGLWIENTEGAKFWLRVMNELKNWINFWSVAIRRRFSIRTACLTN